MKPRVLVTGAQGFLGAALVAQALERGWLVSASARRAMVAPDHRIVRCHAGDLALADGWKELFLDIDTVIHCAGRAHKLNDAAACALAAFRQVNVDGTMILARRAAQTGVRRFVFISSIGVNGIVTQPGKPFTEEDLPAPQSPYGQSKLEAEQALRALGCDTGMEIVIVRPPLVYGPAAPGNFGALIRAVRAGWPLPLGAVRNARSVVALGNLVDFVLLCATHPRAANQTFLVSDGADLSTPALVRAIAAAAGVRPRLLSVPPWLLRVAGKLLRKENAVQGLCGSLQVDVSKARQELAWRPPMPLADALQGILQRDKSI